MEPLQRRAHRNRQPRTEERTVRSQLFEQAQESAYRGMHLQNRKMLKVGLEGEFLARQGSMVAYQGDIDFSYQGSGSVGRFFKKAFTGEDRKSTRLNSSHVAISYAVFCLKKK